MKPLIKKILRPLLAISLSVSGAAVIATAVAATQEQPTKAEALYNPSTHYEVSDTASELASYYSTISSSDTGTSLLGKLQTLNSNKRKRTMGYSTMGTSASSSPYIYTDYKLGSTTKDSNGQVYGSTIASFYTKADATSWNREHMWPNSRGGSAVEGDILHTRPTISSENSSRGNSFYVEGMNNSSNGWDPKTAGYEEWVRGECARVILYCVVANSSFSLSDASAISSGQSGYTSTMGDMDTLIKWHFAYTPNQYEINRNNGAEYLQGNRNPFVDHPEYVAKIWSNFNSNISSICSSNSSTYSSWTPGSCSTYGTNDASGGTTPSTDPSISVSPSTASVVVEGTTSLTATLSNITNSSNVTWYSDDESVATVAKGTTTTSSSVATVTGVATGTAHIYCMYGSSVSAFATVTVRESGSGVASSATINFAEGGNCTSTSGSFTGVSFKTAQSSAQNAPAYNTNSHELRMYYASTGNGNTFTLTPDSGYTITGVTITASSDSYTPTVKYNIDGGSDQSGTWSSTTMSISGIEASSSFVFRNANTSNTQLRIKSVDVSLSSGETPTTKTLSSIAVSNPQTSYSIGDTFVKPAVTATYSDGSTATVTSSATCSGYDMSTAGTQTVTVSYTEGGVTKTTTYSITVTSSGSTTTYELVTDGLSAGDKVVIVAQANRSSTSGFAMKNTLKNNYYFDVASASMSNQKLTYTTGMGLWTVGGSNGTYTFYSEADSKYFQGLTSGTYKNLALVSTATSGTSWVVAENAAGTGYDMHTTYSGTNLYLEYYSSKSSFSAYSASATDYVLNFYREVESNTAEEFATTFMSKLICDSTGATGPTFASGYSWSVFSSLYSDLPSTEQNTLKNATASESGTIIEKAMYRYDYIIAKYGVTNYSNFIGRTVKTLPMSVNFFSQLDGTSTTALIVIVSVIGLTSIGGIIFLKKRKEN
jgi:endonuclease I